MLAEAQVASEPAVIAAFIRARAPRAARVGLRRGRSRPVLGQDPEDARLLDGGRWRAALSLGMTQPRR